MENWCYDKPTFYGFAKHYQTNEPLPQEIFEKLVALKHYNAGMTMLRQLYFGKMDMELHSNYDPNNTKGTYVGGWVRRRRFDWCCWTPSVHQPPTHLPTYLLTFPTQARPSLTSSVALPRTTLSCPLWTKTVSS